MEPLNPKLRAEELAKIPGTGVTAPQLFDILSYLQKNWAVLSHSITLTKRKAVYHCKKTGSLPRSFVVSEDDVYILLKIKIGDGGDKVVKLALGVLSGQFFAAATSRGDKVARLIRDFEFQKLFDEPKCIAFYVKKRMIKGILINRYAPYGDLYHYFFQPSRFHLEFHDLHHCMMQLALLVQAMHAKGLVHADLSLQNILIDWGADGFFFRVADFGLTWSIGDKKPHDVGTIPYAAPEIFTGDPITAKVDIYALGLIFWLISHGGRFPSWMKEVNDLTLLEEKWKWWRNRGHSPINNYLYQMMSPNPDVRPTIDEVVTDLPKCLPQPSPRRK